MTSSDMSSTIRVLGGTTLLPSFSKLLSSPHAILLASICLNLCQCLLHCIPWQMHIHILMNNIVHAFFHRLESFFQIHCALDIYYKYCPKTVCLETPTNSQDFFSSSCLVFCLSWTTFWFLASFNLGCPNFFHSLIGCIILSSLQSSRYFGLVCAPYYWCNLTIATSRSSSFVFNSTSMSHEVAMSLSCKKFKGVNYYTNIELLLWDFFSLMYFIFLL